MSKEESRELEAGAEGGAIDLDTDTDAASELDAAMREALEAIETGESGEEESDAAAGEQSDPDLVTALQREAEEHRDLALRSRADLENYRKRVQRERQEERRFRAFEPMREIVQVIDNLERALASSGSVEDLKNGVEMILRQMKNLLKTHGVERIEALGQGFDPSVHEAVGSDEDPNIEAPTVSEELQPGYVMQGRLLRPAVVRVAMPAKTTKKNEV